MGTTAGSNLSLISGTTIVPASYNELCQFFFMQDPVHITESFRRLMTLADPMTDSVRHVEMFQGAGVVLDGTQLNPVRGSRPVLPLFASRWASFRLPFPLWMVRRGEGMGWEGSEERKRE